MEWPFLIVAAVCALVAVAVAFWVDHDSSMKRQRILDSPPDQPSLAGLPSPRYLTESHIKQSAERSSVTSDTAEVRSAIATATPLTSRLASNDFATDPASERAVLRDPVVWIAESVTTMHDLFGLIRLARQHETGLVIAVGRADQDVVRTLAVNVLTGTVACLVVVTDQLDQVADRTGGTVLSAADVMAGYLPTSAIGHCRIWVADHEHSWVIA